MNHLFGGLVLAIGCALVAPAFAGSRDKAVFTILNESRDTVNCQMRRAGSNIREIVSIRAGKEWRGEYGSSAVRRLWCRNAVPVWHSIRPGVRYRMVPNRSGMIMFVAAP